MKKENHTLLQLIPSSGLIKKIPKMDEIQNMYNINHISLMSISYKYFKKVYDKCMKSLLKHFEYLIFFDYLYLLIILIKGI